MLFFSPLDAELSYELLLKRYVLIWNKVQQFDYGGGEHSSGTMRPQRRFVNPPRFGSTITIQTIIFIRNALKMIWFLLYPALEMRRGGNSIVGSNPTLFAILFNKIKILYITQHYTEILNCGL